jgi:hypothetical protein
MMHIFLSKLGRNDVLLGRGTGPNEQEGNKIFRLLAAQLLKSVDWSTNSISKHDLAKKLVDEVHSRKGRFARQLTKEEAYTVARDLFQTSDRKFIKQQKLNDLYVVVPEEVALDKAKQSFRHQLRLMLNEQPNSEASFLWKKKKTPPSSPGDASLKIDHIGGHDDDFSAATTGRKRFISMQSKFQEALRSRSRSDKHDALLGRYATRAPNSKGYSLHASTTSPILMAPPRPKNNNHQGTITKGINSPLQPPARLKYIRPPSPCPLQDKSMKIEFESSGVIYRRQSLASSTSNDTMHAPLRVYDPLLFGLESPASSFSLLRARERTTITASPMVPFQIGTRTLGPLREPMLTSPWPSYRHVREKALVRGGGAHSCWHDLHVLSEARRLSSDAVSGVGPPSTVDTLEALLQLKNPSFLI